ncbi:MAG: flavin reductase family protein [Elusimicrobiota bacterium]|jgi:flavin reductase (DIM6/NTAB) family NADH-FMN oxidoreductase RutF|nr:flavin reductase family protein [Elusimicrobiota bacterium]
MQKPFNFEAGKTLDILSAGAFLTTQSEGRLNTMTISWGAIGIMWGKPVFAALVRSSRFTHGLIEAAGEFTVSLPSEDMQKALALCGAASGRDIDKFEAAKLKSAPSVKIKTPRIDCKGTHYECLIRAKAAMTPQNTAAEVKKIWYQDNDYHTFYFGEIVNTEVL